ncbi:WH2 domain-containing protein [Strongyloides ratti]|uniref:WH2 domain-containing protein n=1 Tax=Strongyloides ratti TaxID=34506 RepID=A0A090L689_STRRB|nr:WH2 domain-containing protein [Strongyloides ratti]CEF65316.1 WH2 domain-containing protein [Strongyloides ratti]
MTHENNKINSEEFIQSSDSENKIIRRKAFLKKRQYNFGKNNNKFKKNKRVYRKRSKIIKSKTINSNKYYSKRKSNFENKLFTKNHLYFKYSNDKNIINDTIYQIPYLSLTTDTYRKKLTTINSIQLPLNYFKSQSLYNIPPLSNSPLNIRNFQKEINNIDNISVNQIIYEPLYPASSFKGSLLSTQQNSEASILAPEIDLILPSKPWSSSSCNSCDTNNLSSNTYSFIEKEKNYLNNYLEENKSKSLHQPRTVKGVKKLNFFHKQNNIQRTKSVDSTISSSDKSYLGRNSLKSLKSLSETFLETDKMVINRESTKSENITSTINLNDNIKKKKQSKFLSFFNRKKSSKKILEEDEKKITINNKPENNYFVESNDKNDKENDKKSSDYRKEIFSFKNTFKESISSFKFNSKKKFRAPNPPDCKDIEIKKDNLSISMPNVNEIEHLNNSPIMISKFKSVFEETKNKYQSTPDLREEQKELVVCTLTNKDYKMTEEDMIIKLNLETVDNFLKDPAKVKKKKKDKHNKYDYRYKQRQVDPYNIKDKTTDEMIRGRIINTVRSNNYTIDNNVQPLNSQILLKESPLPVSDSSEELVREYNKLKILYEKLKKSVDSTQELTSQRSFNLQASIIEQHNVVKKLCEQVKLEKELKEKVTEGEMSPMMNPKTNYQLDKDGRLINNNITYHTPSSQSPEYRNNSTTIRIDTFHMDTYSSNTTLHHSNGKIIGTNNFSDERLYENNEKPKSTNYINNRYIDNTNHSKYYYNDKSFSKKDDSDKITKLWFNDESNKYQQNNNKLSIPTKNNHYEKIKPNYNNRLEEEMRTQMEREMKHKEERKLVEEEVMSGYNKISKPNSTIINLSFDNENGKFNTSKNNIYNNFNNITSSSKSTIPSNSTISYNKNFPAPKKELILLKSPTKNQQNFSTTINNNIKNDNKNFFQLDNKESVINQMKNTLRKVSPPIEKTGMILGRVIDDDIPRQKISPSSKNSESGISSDSSPSTSPLPPPPLFNNNGTYTNKTFKHFLTSNDNYTKLSNNEIIEKPRNPPPPPPSTGLNIKNNINKLNNNSKNQNSKNDQTNRNDLLAEIRNFGGASRLKKQQS